MGEGGWKEDGIWIWNGYCSVSISQSNTPTLFLGSQERYASLTVYLEPVRLWMMTPVFNARATLFHALSRHMVQDGSDTIFWDRAEAVEGREEGGCSSPQRSVIVTVKLTDRTETGEKMQVAYSVQRLEFERS